MTERHSRRATKEVRLSTTDRGIIRCLRQDARSSIVRIAKSVRAPESTIRHRLRRLVKDGLIEFAVVTNPLRFGFQVWAIIEIQAQPSKIRSVAQKLAEVPEVNLVAVMSGNYDVYAGALFRTQQDLLNFITGPIARIPGIQRISTASMLEIVKRTVTIGIPDGDI